MPSCSCENEAFHDFVESMLVLPISDPTKKPHAAQILQMKQLAAVVRTRAMGSQGLGSEPET